MKTGLFSGYFAICVERFSSIETKRRSYAVGITRGAWRLSRRHMLIARDEQDGAAVFRADRERDQPFPAAVELFFRILSARRRRLQRTSR